MTFYAVANGRSVGIFFNWNDCNNSVKGYKNCLFKKFDTKEEADNFIKVNDTNTPNIMVSDDNVFNPDYYVYTDGSCSNNGRDNALAGIGIFFGRNDNRNISKKNRRKTNK